MKKEIDKYDRRSVFTELNDFCYLSKENDFMEITEWKNGDGFDVTLSATHEQMFSLTYGQFKALKKLIKEFDNE